MHYPMMDIQADFEINWPVGYLINAKRNYFHRRTLPLKKSCSVQMTVFEIVARHNVVNWIQRTLRHDVCSRSVKTVRINIFAKNCMLP